MPRLSLTIVAVLLAVGGYVFNQHFELDGVSGIQVKPRSDKSATAVSDVVPARATDTIRICTFNIQVFGQSKLEKPEAMNVLVEVARQFDVIAIQEIRSEAQDVMPRFVQMINATGRRYDYVIGPRLGRTVSKEQYAYLFDTETIQTDRSALYTLADPDDLLHREPLVGWFRTRGPPADQAFTFSLVNIHTDPDEVDLELNVLDDAYRAIMNDDRREDDVILLGDFNAAPDNFGQLGEVSGIMAVIADQTTNTRGTKLYDNILFRPQATSEFTGRAGVMDLMREFNLTMEQALQVSDHFPVWAEFSVYEGGRMGDIAERPGTTPR